MEIREHHQDGILVMRISGQIDSTTGPMLSDRLDAVIAKEHVHLVLDLSDVPYMSSAGLRVLSIALKAVRATDVSGDMCLASLSKTVAHAFRISGFNQVFNIYDTVPEAIAALAASRDVDLG
jgi:anti-sigma B factor antagonist